MIKRRSLIPIILAGILIASGIIAGITVLQQRGILPTYPGTGILAVQLTDPPNVPQNVSDIYLSFSDVKVHSKGVVNLNQGWYSVASAGKVDLMKLQNVSMTIGSGIVDPGTFDLVEFDIVSAQVTFEGINYTAYVPNSKMSIPISKGVTVQSNAISAFLIDLSPTVVPYQDGVVLGFVLVPSAISVPIPSLSWTESNTVQGSQINDSSWLNQNETEYFGNLTITDARLSNSSLSLTVLNTGNASVMVSELDIVQRPANSTCNDCIVEQAGESAQTISSFQVLSNATLVPEWINLTASNASVGFDLEPNQTITLVFAGLIISNYDGENGTAQPLSPVHGGQAYFLVVDGDVSSAYVNSTATG